MAPVTRAQEPEDDEQKQDVKITLYWLEKSRAQRILWLLEELKLEYELKTFKRQNMLAPPELKKIHPLGKSPIITLTSTATNSAPITIAESSNIIEYLLTHFGPSLIPAQYGHGREGQVGGETESYLRYRYFMHYSEGSLMPLLVTALVLRTMREKSPFMLRPVIGAATGAVESRFLNPNLETHLEFLEAQLKTAPDQGHYLCGPDLTGADIAMSFPVIAAKGRAGLTKEKYPLLWAYVERLEGTGSYGRAMEIIRERGENDGIS